MCIVYMNGLKKMRHFKLISSIIAVTEAIIEYFMCLGTLKRIHIYVYIHENIYIHTHTQTRYRISDSSSGLEFFRS